MEKKNSIMRLIAVIAIALFSTINVTAQSVTYHVVKDGETLSSIAKKYSVKKSDIVSMNPDAVKEVYPGMELQIPSKNNASRKTEVYEESYTGNAQQTVNVDSEQNEYIKYAGKGLEIHMGLGKISPEKGSSQDYYSYGIGFNLAQFFGEHSPFFIDEGINVVYTYYKEENQGMTTKFTMISSTIPLNIGYIFVIPNTSIAISPFAGLTAKFHYSGKIKQEYNGKSKSVDIFDEKDMGKDGKYNNMQLAWQAGLKFCLRENNTAFIRLSYGEDLTEFAKKLKTKQFTFAIGCYI